MHQNFNAGENSKKNSKKAIRMYELVMLLVHKIKLALSIPLILTVSTINYLFRSSPGLFV